MSSLSKIKYSVIFWGRVGGDVLLLFSMALLKSLRIIVNGVGLLEDLLCTQSQLDSQEVFELKLGREDKDTSKKSLHNTKTLQP